MTITLDSPIADAVGGRTAKPIEKSLGLHTVGELLRHYPRRLAERGELTDLDELRVDDEVTVLATVKKAAMVGRPPGQRAVITVSDGRGELDLVFFGGKRVEWRVDNAVVGDARPVLRQGRRLQPAPPARPPRMAAAAATTRSPSTRPTPTRAR